MVPYVDELNVFTAHVASQNYDSVQKYIWKISCKEVRDAAYISNIHLI
jgi:hypothetical protein